MHEPSFSGLRLTCHVCVGVGLGLGFGHMHEPSLLRLVATMPCVCQGFTTSHARAEPTEACGWHDMCVLGSGLGLGSHA